MTNNIFKTLSLLLIGIIIGYSINNINFASSSVPSISTNGSIKIVGQEDAPITIVEYSDFQCPLCARYFDDSYSIIINRYVKSGKAKYEFRHFPLNIHPQAVEAALASECALEQNKFWEMHDQLFDQQSEWSGNSNATKIFKQITANLGMDQNQFNKCLEDKKYQKNVDIDYQNGIKEGVRGTPTFLINDKLIVGAQPTETFTNLLDELLAENK